jgi:hypothetical protein
MDAFAAGPFVPKVHPLAREAGPDDPLEIVAEPVAGGDPDYMLECLLDEFLWMGYPAEAVLGLFRDPAYPVLCALRERLGDEAVRERVAQLQARTGVLRFRETIDDTPEPEDEHAGVTELIQLNVRPRAGR